MTLQNRVEVLLNALIVAGIVTCIGLLAFSLTGYYPVMDLLQIAVFLGGPLAVALSLTVLIRTSLETKLTVLLLLVSVSTVLYIGELWLAVFPNQNSPVSPEIRQQRQSKLEVIKGLRAEGIRAYPLLHGWAIRNRKEAGLPLTIKTRRGELLPLSGGVSRATIALCSEAGKLVLFDSDEHGFNNPPGTWDGEDNNLALIGDSFTQGYCVPADQHLMAPIRRRYPRALNLGLTGAGPLMELAILKEFLPRIRPSNVIWLYYEGNDLDDLEAERNNPLLRKYLEHLEPSFRQGLIEQQPEIDRQLAAFLDQVMAKVESDNKTESRSSENILATFLSVAKFSALRDRIGFGVSLPPDRDIVQLLREIFTNAKQTVEHWGGTLHIVYLPTYTRYQGLRKPSSFQARNAVMSIIHDLDLPVIDLTRRFETEQDPRRFWVHAHGHGHYSQEGYRLVGEKLRNYLENWRDQAGP